ncbi:hypothetical protein RFI_32683 [Reticulomyxa filosa]|uniref:Uncharacterized protein n=1 Tax=Reticulomyxa filosa TaxID=46433 RepID=X6LS34_RETFI|nr:hypothetical protein RFI_32683 [Reticulomyxa filosa]|eukprot:ETO04713.1 hypothetical protein RFI_32683 [Reticulomyxa filosa]
MEYIQKMTPEIQAPELSFSLSVKFMSQVAEKKAKCMGDHLSYGFHKRWLDEGRNFGPNWLRYDEGELFYELWINFTYGTMFRDPLTRISSLYYYITLNTSFAFIFFYLFDMILKSNKKNGQKKSTYKQLNIFCFVQIVKQNMIQKKKGLIVSKKKRQVLTKI